MLRALSVSEACPSQLLIQTMAISHEDCGVNTAMEFNEPKPKILRDFSDLLRLYERTIAVSTNLRKVHRVIRYLDSVMPWGLPLVFKVP